MEAIVNLSYLIAVTLLIVGLRRLSSPATARSGNLLAAVGMGLAIVATILSPIESGGNNYTVITVAMVTGTIIGLIMASKVQMTAMPELVSLFNGLGGACAVSISLIELYNYQKLMASG
ncbi:MAG: NAD(P)(+) transhydrogenase (Re/Si-specific) subunit beta, partial [Cyclobacteriaceae bacterium]